MGVACLAEDVTIVRRERALMALSVPADATQVPSGWKATVFT